MVRPTGVAMLVALLLTAKATPAVAHVVTPPILKAVGFDQRLGAEIPLDLVFRDDTGHARPLRSYFGGVPVVLTLNQFHCPNLCPLVLEGLAASIRHTPLVLGRDYRVISVSIDPRETPPLAGSVRERMLRDVTSARARAGWRFLTGDQTSISRLAAAVGFRYVYDRASDQYAHPVGVIVLTPTGSVARYLFGMDFPARDLRLALVESSRGRIGGVIDHVLLTCYRYDATRGRYTPIVMGAVRIGGVLTVLGLGALLAALFHGERARRGRS